MIGRPDAAAAIARFMARVPTGRVGLIIEGDPGIGKTTVVRDSIREAHARGFQVLEARPAEAEADFSFAALSDLIGSQFDAVRDELPPPQREALEVALLLREAETPADPRTMAAALLTAVTRLSARDPLVIVIDDAQWLDAPSRRAIEWVARRLPPRLGMVVATRSQPPARTPIDLEAALPPGDVEHLVLAPLSLASLHRLISSGLGLQLARPMLVRLGEASDGNPMYALEIAGAIARQGTVPGLGDRLPVPPSLHDLLLDRVDRLSPPARTVATAAAALARPSVGTLEAAYGSELDLDAALVEAEEAGILVSDGSRLAFSHPLLAETLYGSLTGSRVRTLHRRLAAVVSDLEERGRHLARSVRPPDDEAAAVIDEAAALATRRGAPDSAAELYDAAVRLTSDARQEDLARRMLGGARALGDAGDIRGAESLATEALGHSRTGSQRARALLKLGSLASYTKTTEVRVKLQERALREAGDDPDLRIEILIALFEQIVIDPVMAERRADEVIGMLRGSGDRSRLAQALIQKFIARTVSGHGADAGLLHEALALEGEAGEPVSTYPLLWYHWIDDLEAARARYRLHDAQFRARGDVARRGRARRVHRDGGVPRRQLVGGRAGAGRGVRDAGRDRCAGSVRGVVHGPVVHRRAPRSHRARPSDPDRLRGWHRTARATLADGVSLGLGRGGVLRG